MSSNIASSSTGGPVILSSDLPTVEEVIGLNAEELNGFLKRRLKNIDSHIDTLKAQQVDGEAFFTLTHEGLKVSGIPLEASARIIKLLNDIKGDQSAYTEKERPNPYPNTKPFPDIRRWKVNGLISPGQRTKYYYADPADTNGNLINKIISGGFIALHGPRASGKTTRIYRTMEQLQQSNYCCF